MFTASGSTFKKINQLTSAGGVIHNDVIMHSAGLFCILVLLIFVSVTVQISALLFLLHLLPSLPTPPFFLLPPSYLGAVTSLPFGGVGHSGIGNYHFRYSFDTFSHHKPVLQTSTGLEAVNQYAGFKIQLCITCMILYF